MKKINFDNVERVFIETELTFKNDKLIKYFEPIQNLIGEVSIENGVLTYCGTSRDGSIFSEIPSKIAEAVDEMIHSFDNIDYEDDNDTVVAFENLKKDYAENKEVFINAFEYVNWEVRNIYKDYETEQNCSTIYTLTYSKENGEHITSYNFS